MDYYLDNCLQSMKKVCVKCGLLFSVKLLNIVDISLLWTALSCGLSSKIIFAEGQASVFAKHRSLIDADDLFYK